MLPHPTTCDAPHARPESVNHREQEGCCAALAKTFEKEVQEKDRDRTDESCRDHRQPKATCEEIDMRCFGDRVDRCIHQTRQDWICGDGLFADTGVPVWILLRGIDRPGEIKPIPLKQRDRKKLSRARVAASDVTETQEIHEDWDHERCNGGQNTQRSYPR